MDEQLKELIERAKKTEEILTDIKNLLRKMNVKLDDASPKGM